jgi:LDH2 family malate/lactate/ureidoglycolate dehydrogenase
LLSPALLSETAAFEADVDQLVNYVKSSKLAEGFTEIMIPGEPERRERERREKNGIPVDDVTWSEIRETGERYGVKLD